ncbi:unnamed protein product [Allacma fusca]|uniref:Uncharacterized protein n=1 Tax=Allacma fusca TaxID=39272 RepID=A0A8J2PLV5_9HEXA|nr:unnamed protein product [Allacma fusca]
MNIWGLSYCKYYELIEWVL